MVDHLYRLETTGVREQIPGEGQPGSTQNGGCGIYINSELKYSTQPDLDKRIYETNCELEAKWIEVISETKSSNKLVGVYYRHPNKKDDKSISIIKKQILEISKGKKEIVITGLISRSPPPPPPH